MDDASVVVATLAVSAAVIVALMCGVLWWVARAGTVKIIDAVWGFGFAAVAVSGLAATWGAAANGVRILLAGLTVVWGVRLGVHMLRRNRGSGEDRRYVELFERHSGSRVGVAALWVCLPQGITLWFVSLPVQIGQASTGGLGWWAAVGAAVWALGFTFETVADAQLARFRADPARRGTVLDSGLWRYSRHPNYFGDACTWWGLYVIACSAWPAALTLASPVLMTWVLARGTGKPLMERHLADRPGYAEYVRRTSGFVPLPPRR